MQLINALKLEPGKIAPGKVKVTNVITKLISKSDIARLKPGTTVVLVFDTDVRLTNTLKRNIENLKRFCSNVKVIFLPQVLNIEDELVKATDVKRVQDLTKSTGIENFKNDFCRMKLPECRRMLERHSLDIQKLWISKVPEDFSFLKKNSNQIKLLSREKMIT